MIHCEAANTWLTCDGTNEFLTSASYLILLQHLSTFAKSQWGNILWDKNYITITETFSSPLFFNNLVVHFSKYQTGFFLRGIVSPLFSYIMSVSECFRNLIPKLSVTQQYLFVAAYDNICVLSSSDLLSVQLLLFFAETHTKPNSHFSLWSLSWKTNTHMHMQAPKRTG